MRAWRVLPSPAALIAASVMVSGGGRESFTLSVGVVKSKSMLLATNSAASLDIPARLQGDTATWTVGCCWHPRSMGQWLLLVSHAAAATVWLGLASPCCKRPLQLFLGKLLATTCCCLLQCQPPALTAESNHELTSHLWARHQPPFCFGWTYVLSTGVSTNFLLSLRCFSLVKM
jgi:hypothetical protein